jgi:hypothetical protein
MECLRAGALCAHAIHNGNDGERNASGNQAILNGRGPDSSLKNALSLASMLSLSQALGK